MRNIKKLTKGGRPLRIAYARVFQEANAFSPMPTTQADFAAFHCMEGDELAAATARGGKELAGLTRNAELSGFCRVAQQAGDVEVVPVWSTFAISGGPVTRETFDWLVEGLVRRLRDAGPVDGIYLALHGSMQVEGLDEAPEGVLLSRVREVVGDGAAIAASYDLHANLAASMVEPIEVAVAFHTNPHRDLYGTGKRAGRLLIATLRGRCNPVHAWRKLPMVLGGGMTIDFLAPMRSVFRRLRAIERRPGVLSANLFMVHPYSNATDLGWATLVTTDGDQALADELAEQLAEAAWEKRKVPLPEMHSPGAAFDRIKKSPWRHVGAVSVVDVDDIVGTGAPGGNTHLLAELVRDDRGLRCYVPLHDPRAVEQLWSSSEGTHVDVTLRGSPGYDDQPAVQLAATVVKRRKTDFGRTVRLDAGNLRVAVTERPPFTVNPRFWRQLGLRPRSADVIVQKSFFHYRIFHAATSFRHFGVESDGASSLRRIRDRDYPVPTWPGKDPEHWKPYDPILRAGRIAAPPQVDRPAT